MACVTKKDGNVGEPWNFAMGAIGVDESLRLSSAAWPRVIGLPIQSKGLTRGRHANAQLETSTWAFWACGFAKAPIRAVSLPKRWFRSTASPSRSHYCTPFPCDFGEMDPVRLFHHCYSTAKRHEKNLGPSLRRTLKELPRVPIHTRHLDHCCTMPDIRRRAMRPRNVTASLLYSYSSLRAAIKSSPKRKPTGRTLFRVLAANVRGVSLFVWEVRVSISER
jgi:hypothetical protein